MVKLADRMTNLQPPPKHWDTDKIGRHLKSAELIFEELSDACPVHAFVGVESSSSSMGGIHCRLPPGGSRPPNGVESGMSKRSRNRSHRHTAQQLAVAGTVAIGLFSGCGASGSDAADAAVGVDSYDAAGGATDAGLTDAGLTDAGLDAALEPDAAVPTGSQRALWFGDFTEDGVDEVRLYDAAVLSSLSIAGVTIVDDIQTLAVSPDGTRLAIALEHDGGNQTLYVVNIDSSGTPTTILAAGDAFGEFNQIAWSPDGATLAYVSDVALNGNKLAYVAPADGSAAPSLVSLDTADGDLDIQSVAWAGNTHVIYRGDPITNGVDNIYSSDVSLSPAVPVPLIPEAAVSAGNDAAETPAFAGGKVYFKSSHEGTIRGYRVDLDGANLEVIPALAALTNDDGDAQFGTFAISPDGTSIAFSADSPVTNLYQIYVAELDGVATVQSNLADANPTPTSVRGPVFEGRITWSADGTMLGVAADWPLLAGDLDNDAAAFIVPATGPAGGVRIWNVGAPNNSQDVVKTVFTSDSSTFFALGDIRSNNNGEAYVTTDLTTADQDTTATLIEDVPANGDVSGLATIQ